MGIYKRLFLLFGVGVSVLLGLFLSVAPAASATIQGLSNGQIQAPSKFSFSNGGSTITGKIGGKTVTYTSGPALLQFPAQTLSSLVNCSGSGCNTFEWKVSPSDTFCLPVGWKPTSNVGSDYYPNHPGSILINASDIHLSNGKVVSATAHLIAFGGTTDAACNQTIAGSSTTGVAVTVSAAVGPPSGAVITQSSLNTAVYKFGSNGSVINATYTLANGLTIPIEFDDQQPYDDTPNFVVKSSDSAQFCSGANLGQPNITLVDGGQSSKTMVIKSVSLPIVTDAAGSCKAGSLPSSSSKGRSVDNSNLSAEILFQWNSDSLQSFGSGSSVLNLVLDNTTGQNSNLLYAKSTGSTCNGSWVVLLSSPKANSGTLYYVEAGGSKVVNGYFAACKLGNDTPKPVTLAGSWSQTPTTPPSGATADSEATCEADSSSNNVSGHQLSFFACPMLAAVDTASSALTGAIENLLSFSIKNSLNSTNGGNAKLAWSNIRDVSSILLVIIMLVMVLSQAVSWGPFDAYTVRKVLPKLVVAVIAMQVSWSLLSYVFDLFNDIGRGVADLLYGPFGGPSQVTISAALGGSGITTTQAGIVSWGALAGVAAIAILSLPTLVIAAWAIVVALLTGFIVLVFRQILLIACLIFAPLAILCWILPNTNKYWKLWYANFNKLLMMFPLIMGLLAVGKIFALITGDSTSGSVILRFIFVIVGFYGPYFLLPKTYKWGGQAMAAASQGISTATKHGTGPVSNYLEGRRERSRWNLARQARKAELTRQAKADFARTMTQGGGNVVQRPFRAGRRFVGQARTMSPSHNPLGEWRTRGRIASTAQAAAEKELKERATEELAPLISQAAQSGNWSEVLDMAQHGGTDQEQEAAIAALASNRQFGIITGSGLHQTPQWRRTMAKDGETSRTVREARADLQPRFTMGSPATPTAAATPPSPIRQVVSTMTPAQLATQDSTFFETLATSPEGFGAGAGAPADLLGFYNRIQDLARDPDRSRSIAGGRSADHINTILASRIADINAARVAGGLPPVPAGPGGGPPTFRDLM